MAPPNTKTESYESSGRGGGVPQPKLHSSSSWPASAIAGAKSAARASLPWMTESPRMAVTLFLAAGRRNPVCVE
jgi:hypothetical protein